MFGLALKASLIGFSYCTAGQLVYTFSKINPDKVIMEQNVSRAEHHMFQLARLPQSAFNKRFQVFRPHDQINRCMFA